MLALGKEPVWRDLLKLLCKKTGVDFGQYEKSLLLRHIKRHMARSNAASMDAYLRIVKRNGNEADLLTKDLLRAPMEFFHDPEVFTALRRLAYRRMPLGGNHVGIRIWVPGCGTGEDVYSLAIDLLEYLQTRGKEYPLQIFATEAKLGAVVQARAAIYGASELQKIPPERLRRFFLCTEEGYRVSREVRETCIFSRHTPGADAPFSHMDLVFCRTLLEPRTPRFRERLIARFGYALDAGGWLVLGRGQTPGRFEEYFEELDAEHSIYRRKDGVPPRTFLLSWGTDALSTEPVVKPETGPAKMAPAPAATERPGIAVETKEPGQQFQPYVNRRVIERYGSAAALVDEHMRILEYRPELLEHTLQHKLPASASLRDALGAKLWKTVEQAIERARGSRAVATAEAPRSRRGAKGMARVCTVVPLALAGGPRHFLVLLRDGQMARPKRGAKGTEAAAHENVKLREELDGTRSYLQSVIEELETTNEELQSSNEELNTANEEVRTSERELYVANEELNTLNLAAHARNDQLAHLNDDLSNLLTSMNIPTVMMDSNLRIRQFTPSAERVLRTQQKDVGRPITDLKTKVEIPDLPQVLNGVLHDLRPYEREVCDAEGRIYLMRVRPYRRAGGKIDGTVLQLLDVTDLRRSLEETRHARDYAEAIVNTVREPLAVLDEELKIRGGNAAFFESVGITEEAVCGHSIYEVGGRRFDTPKVRLLLEQLTGGSERVSDEEIEYRDRSGDQRTVLVNAKRLAATGIMRLVLVAMEDITERKRAAEARYRRLFESALDGIVLMDAVTGEVLDVNPYAERLLGYSCEEMAGRKLWETPPMAKATQARAMLEDIRGKGAMRFDALTLVCREGREIQAEVIANEYTDMRRRAIQLNIRDVSERRKFELELRETQKLESLGLLAGGIAHDFNNLLTAILGNASLAYTETEPNDPVQLRLREIVRATERASFLTRQMLAYAGRGRFVMEAIDLGELVRELATLLQTSVPKKVELKLALGPDVPPVEADAAQLQQVVMNLVINAAEAIRQESGGTVEVCTSLREVNAEEAQRLIGPAGESGTYVQLEVEDNGEGMDEETRSRIFDPFFTTKFTGRGLGLAAVRGIVKAHGGMIEVRSAPGKGTCFTILLRPARRKRARRAKKEESPRSIPPGSVALVIDDEQSVRALASSVLSKEGMRVLTADNGETGVKLFREHHKLVNVVLLDATMPVMSGEETLRQLKDIEPDVLVVLSSGFDESEAVRRFAGLDPERFLQKPYSSEALVQTVAAALEREEA